MAKRPRTPTRVRLRDVAEVVGVSVNTVSRALNDKWDVSATTRIRICDVARRLGYSPNVVARSLVHGQTRTIGLVVTDATNPFYALLIRAVEAITSEAGFGLLLATSSGDVGKEQRAIALMRERRVDGILFTAIDVNAPHVKELLKDTVPTVLLTRWPDGYKGPCVGIDNAQGTRLAVRHLLGLGHRRIAHLSRPGSDPNPRQRSAGWRAELRAAGLNYERTLMYPAAPSIEGGLQGGRWLLELRPRPTAVFTYSDVQAIGLVRGLQDAGVDVPGEISVVGFDDIPLACLVSPPLTTVSQHISRIGQLGTEMLIRILQGKRLIRKRLVLEPEVVERASTAPPSRPLRRIASR